MFTLLTSIYYLSTAILLFIELGWIASPIEKSKEARNFFLLTKVFKEKKWDEYSDEYKSKLKSYLPYLCIYIWLFIGLFSFQWVGFLAFLVFNVLVITPLSKLTRPYFAYTILHFISSIIGFAFGVFVIINHYYLGFDLLEMLSQFLK